MNKIVYSYSSVGKSLHVVENVVTSFKACRSLIMKNIQFSHTILV